MSAETPGSDHDDTEAMTSLLVHMRCLQQTADRLAAGIMASDWLAAYVAHKVEPIEQDARTAWSLYRSEQAEHNRAVGVAGEQEERAEKAERERDEAREERDYHQARADVLLAKMSGRVALRGGKPGDYWREWHLSHCGAAQAAATAEQQRDEAQAEASDVGHDYDRRGERLWRLAALAGWTPGNESDNDATAEAYVTEALTEARAVIERVTALLGEWTCGNCGERAAVRVVVARILTAREAAAERRGAVNALRTIATQIDIEIPTMRSDHVLPYDRLATWLRERADRIEAGDD